MVALYVLLSSIKVLKYTIKWLVKFEIFRDLYQKYSVLNCSSFITESIKNSDLKNRNEFTGKFRFQHCCEIKFCGTNLALWSESRQSAHVI